jgi:hypothetical protein
MAVIEGCRKFPEVNLLAAISVCSKPACALVPERAGLDTPENVELGMLCET